MSLGRNKKSILANLIFSKIFLIFCIVLFLAIMLGLAKNSVKKYQVNSEVEELKKQISQLEGQNKEFGDLIKFLNTETYIEQEAKLKFGYKKPGEQLVVIPLQEQGSQTSATESYQELSNPAKWLRYFLR